MDLRESLSNVITAATREAFPDAVDVIAGIESPRMPEHGDFASNVAMGLAKTLRQAPLRIAEAIAAKIVPGDLIAKVEVKPPGFINIFINDATAVAGLQQILDKGAEFGKSTKFAGKSAIVEYVSANPTGPLHIGHARNAAVGDCIARCLENGGYRVWREYYYNDAGAQIRRLGDSMKARYLQQFDSSVEFPEDGYHGEYVTEFAQELAQQVGNAWRDKDPAEFAEFAKARVVKLIDADMAALGIHFDQKFSENSLHESGEVDRTLALMRERGCIYDQDGAVWLRTTEDGDEKDRVLVKQDGEKTYLAPDIAYHRNKFERGFDLVVNLLGADHHSYIVRLRAAMRGLGYDPERLHCLIYQLVTVMKGGEAVKFGKRAGDYITVREMIEELGPDVVRFFFNVRSSDSHMNFDWDLAKEQSQKNPVYYVQYAHARCCSIARKAEELGLKEAGADLTLLNSPEEQALMKLLYDYPRVVELAAAHLAPHHYVAYLRSVAESFNSYFTSGNTNEDLRVLMPDKPALSAARLALVRATRIVLANALGALGVSAPERM